MKILVLHGPNLNLLGTREPEVYGSETLEDIVVMLTEAASSQGAEIESFQSNEEGALVSKIHAAIDVFDGIVFNPAAYTHTSVALCDALRAVEVPCVEVHLSNTAAREEFRHRSLTVGACIGQVMGFGAQSYVLALKGLIDYIERTKKK